MNVEETKERPAERYEGFQSLVEITKSVQPSTSREAETLEPLADRRPASLLQRARDTLDWKRLPGFGESKPKPEEKLQVVLARRFAIFVLLPTAMLAVYLYFIASDQYIAESQFAVRGNVEQLSDESAGKFTSLIHQHNSQDGYIVREYIQSRALVEEAEKSLNISKMFSRDDADFWSRYRDPQPLEYLTKYWKQHVSIRIESISGVLTLQVRAFTPEDAVAISEFIIDRSEQLVNNISTKARADMLAQAEIDVGAAEQRLKAARLALQKFRNQWGIIDPMKTAEGTITAIQNLNTNKLKAESDLKVLRDSKLDENSRGIQVLVATIAATDAQIKQLQNQLTTSGFVSGTPNNISQALLEFEGLMIEQTIAEKLHESMRLLLDRIRVAVQKQEIYLSTFVPPALPTSAQYPRRIYVVVLGLFCFFVLWSCGSLIHAGFMDVRI